MADTHGEWRAVPGFSADKLLVSSLGFCRLRIHDKLSPPYLPNIAANGYRRIMIDGRPQKVHRLVCAAFHGDRKDETVDHINRDRGDNRADNLRWCAEFGDQIRNQSTRKPKCTGRPVVLRHETWDVFTPGRLFESSYDAALVLNLDSSHVRHVANGIGTQTKGWVAMFADRNEDAIDGEQWKNWLDRALVSSCGRAKTRLPNSNHVWSAAYTPEPAAGTHYAFLCHKLFHRIVYEAFNGPIPQGMTIDHIDQDKANNRLSNLRLATYAQQNANKSMKPVTTRSLIVKKAVWVASERLGNWEKFDSITEACKALSNRTGKNFRKSSVSRILNQSKPTFMGYNFSYD